MKPIRLLRRVAIILVLLCGATLILSLTIWNERSAPDPTIYGRTLTQWLTSDSLRTNKAAAELALVTLGKQAVPTLRTMLHSGNKLGRLWSQKAPQWLNLRVRFGAGQFDQKDRAMAALKLLGRDGRDATPDLLLILQDSSEPGNHRLMAISTLDAIWAEDSVVLPVLDALTQDPLIGKEAAFAAALRRSNAERRKNARTVSRVNSRAQGRLPFLESPSSNSFLGNTSLWGDEGATRIIQPRPGNSPLATNMPSR